MQVDSIKDLVEKLIERRKSLGISQSQLAQLCDLSVNGISKFESNAGDREIKLSTIYKLSDVLGFKISLEFEE